jgi:undecaprenyl-diphosphatase
MHAMRWVCSRNFRRFAALVALATLSVLFAGLAALVTFGRSVEFDKSLLMALRVPGRPDDPLGPPWLEEAARDITALGSNTVLILLLIGACCYLVLQQKWRTALFLVLASSSGGVTSFLLKAGFDRPRPALLAQQAEVYTSSFPSSHAMVSAVTFLTLGALLARSEAAMRLKAFLLSMALVLTVIVGASRVYLGVHWPSDVVAGWAAGTAWALAAWMLARPL